MLNDKDIGTTEQLGTKWNEENESSMAEKFPLHVACRDNNLRRVDELLGILERNVQNAHQLIAEDSTYNWTAAHFAAYFGHVDCLMYLEKAAQIFNDKRRVLGLPLIKPPMLVTSSKFQQTPLHVAAFASHDDCVSWMILNAAVSPNIQDLKGETALHKACRSGSKQVVSSLVNLGAKDIKNSSNLTAAEVAATLGYLSVATLIAGPCANAPLVSGTGYYGYIPPAISSQVTRSEDLLTSDAVARNEVAIAGKKRVRCSEEEDDMEMDHTKNPCKKTKLNDFRIMACRSLTLSTSKVDIEPRGSPDSGISSGSTSPPFDMITEDNFNLNHLFQEQLEDGNKNRVNKNINNTVIFQTAPKTTISYSFKSKSDFSLCSRYDRL